MQISKNPPIYGFLTQKTEIGFSQNLTLILARFHNLFINAALTHFARMLCTVPQAVKPCHDIYALVARLQAHTGIITDITIITHIPQKCKRKRANITPYIQNFNIDLFGGLSVCNLFSFGDAQAPTMQGRLYNGVPCLEPFACTTCRRYKRNCYSIPATVTITAYKSDFHALQTIIT